MELIRLLNLLKSALLSQKISRKQMINALKELLLWLNDPENDTDNNCRAVDSFVSFELLPEPKIKEIPEDSEAILFDMGATLHDAHTNPEIAENFESRPSQLLERVMRLESP